MAPKSQAQIEAERLLENTRKQNEEKELAKQQQLQALAELSNSPLSTPEVTSNVAEPVEVEKKTVVNGTEILPGKDYVFETLILSPVPRHEMLGATCKIFDEGKQRMRQIRYIPTATSIFVEEQEKEDPEYKNLTLPYIGFYHNQIIASGDDKRLVEYLLSHDAYDANPHRLSSVPAKYKLLDKEQYNVKEKARHKKELEALTLIEDTDASELMPVSRIIFGITEESETATLNKLRELVKTPKGKNEKESAAERLLDNINDPMVRRRYTIQQAIDSGIIRLEGDKVMWGEENGAYLTTVSSKNNPRVQVNDIAKFSMTGLDGDRFYKRLKEKTA